MEAKAWKNRLIGKVFGKLTVLSFDKMAKGNKTIWKCQCECGNTKSVRNDCLIKGSTKSCGCLNKLRGKENLGWKGFGDISGSRWQVMQKAAVKRNLEFNITIEYAWNLFLKQNGICAISGRAISFSNQKSNKFSSASLDRIDSSKGYLEGNVQWVHLDINRMKWDFNLKYFLKTCQEISSFNASFV